VWSPALPGSGPGHRLSWGPGRQRQRENGWLRACGAAVPGGPPAGGAAAPGVPVSGPRPSQAVVRGTEAAVARAERDRVRSVALRACGAAVPGGPPAGGAAAPGVPVSGPRPPQAVVRGTEAAVAPAVKEPERSVASLWSCSYRGSPTRRRHCAGGPPWWSPALQAVVPGRGGRHGPSAPSGAQHLVQNPRKSSPGGPRPLPSLSRGVREVVRRLSISPGPREKISEYFQSVGCIPRSPSVSYPQVPGSLLYPQVSSPLGYITRSLTEHRGVLELPRPAEGGPSSDP